MKQTNSLRAVTGIDSTTNLLDIDSGLRPQLTTTSGRNPAQHTQGREPPPLMNSFTSAFHARSLRRPKLNSAGSWKDGGQLGTVAKSLGRVAGNPRRGIGSVPPSPHLCRFISASLAFACLAHASLRTLKIPRHPFAKGRLYAQSRGKHTATAATTNG